MLKDSKLLEINIIYSCKVQVQWNLYISHLKENIDDDDKERVGEVVEEPDLNGFDDGGAGQAVGHREVHRGQHHHAGSDKIRVLKIIKLLKVAHMLMV